MSDLRMVSMQLIYLINSLAQIESQKEPASLLQPLKIISSLDALEQQLIDF